MASSSSSPPMKHQVFLSFRGEDTRLNFTSHLRKALKDAGMSVFFDEDTLERGVEISPALSRAIEASRLSIVVLSPDYASSKSCLAELSDIMHSKTTQGHIVLPIFYHVDPSHVRNLGGSFKKSFDNHESKRLHQVQRWKTAFADVGKLKGWHIEGGKFDKPESDYIKEIVGYVIKEVSSSQSETVSKDYVGIDNKKEAILNLIKKEDSRVVGLWGMGGIGKTTLADVVYKEVSTNFEGCYFLQNVREEVEKQGKKSLRNELLSVLLKEEKIRIDGPSIGSSYRERLNNKRVIVVLDDDVNDSEQVEWMGVEHFGDRSKIIITSRDIQVLKNARAGDNIYEVEKLDKSDSLQLFSTLAFQQLNPTVDFLDLSYKFVAYADGVPLALKVLGSKLFSKSRKVWESEVDKLKQYPEPKISHILMNSFDELDEVQKNIFLDIACFFKGESRNDVEDILNYMYKGAVSGISSLFDKSLLDINSYGRISMHDMFEEIAKEIVCKESDLLEKRSRLWKPEDVCKVLENNIDLPNLKVFDVSNSRKLKKIPVLSGAINLKILLCHRCESLIELPCLSNLKYLVEIDFEFCRNLKKFPELPNNIGELVLEDSKIEEVPDSIEHLVNLHTLNFKNCPIVKIPKLPRSIEYLSISRTQVEEVSLDPLSKLRVFVMSYCGSLKSVSGLPPNLMTLDASDCTSLEKVSFARQNLRSFDLDEEYSMKFLNCFCLNQESIDNIEANAMLKIQSLTEGWIHRKYSNDFICCFPGNKMSANGLEYWSMNSCLNFRISPSGSSVRRFLVFAICLVADLSPYRFDLELICEYQLAAASGNDGGGRFEKFRTEFYLTEACKDDHVWIVCGKDMLNSSAPYSLAAPSTSVTPMRFLTRSPLYRYSTGLGVTGSASWMNSDACQIFGKGHLYFELSLYKKEATKSYTNQNFDFQDDANIEEVHDHSATETRFSLIAGEEGDKGSKRERMQHKEIKAARGICVVGPDYDVEDLRAVTSRIDKSGEEFCSGVEKISVGGCEDRWWLQFY
ncbi:hypothetical protein V6N13_122120 [Hibiscus sabdariffa]